MAKNRQEFDKRGVKIIRLSVNPVERHADWAADIKEKEGYTPNYPMIGDADYKASSLRYAAGGRFGRTRQAHCRG